MRGGEIAMMQSESESEAAWSVVESASGVADIAMLVARVLLGIEADECDIDETEFEMEGDGLADGERGGF